MVGRFLVLSLLLSVPALHSEPVESLDSKPEARHESASKEGEPVRSGDLREGNRDETDYPSKFRKRLERMSPEDRDRFIENWKRWKDMGEKERRDWQKRAEEERRRVDKAITDTLNELDLDLNEEEQEVFALRYRQERRKIEKDLCAEMQAKREERVQGMLGKLKEEFVERSREPAEATAAPDLPEEFRTEKPAPKN